MEFRMPHTTANKSFMEEHLLERQMAQPMTRNKRLALVYNDSHNYIMSRVQPLEEWYQPRETLIREYAALDWNALGTALSPHLPQAVGMCASIQKGWNQLLEEVNSKKRFQLTLLCATLGKVDHLRHILLPSFTEDIVEPKARETLEHIH
jgi:hypothetical protein